MLAGLGVGTQPAPPPSGRGPTLPLTAVRGGLRGAGHIPFPSPTLSHAPCSRGPPPPGEALVHQPLSRRLLWGPEPRCWKLETDSSKTPRSHLCNLNLSGTLLILCVILRYITKQRGDLRDVTDSRTSPQDGIQHNDGPTTAAAGNARRQRRWLMPPCTRPSRPRPVPDSGSPAPLRPDGGGPGDRRRGMAALGRRAGPRCDRHSRGVTLIPVPAQPPHSAFPSLSLLLRPLGGSRLKGPRHLAAGAHSARSGSRRKLSREGDWDSEPNKQGFGEEPGKPRRGPEDCAPGGELAVCRERLEPSRSDPMQTSPTTAAMWQTADWTNAAPA